MQNGSVTQLQSDIELRVESVRKMECTGKVVTTLNYGVEWTIRTFCIITKSAPHGTTIDQISFPIIIATNQTATELHAGEVAMIADNRKCGVGKMSRAKIGAIKCPDSKVVDRIESMSLSYNIDDIDIYISSCNPTSARWPMGPSNERCLST